MQRENLFFVPCLLLGILFPNTREVLGMKKTIPRVSSEENIYASTKGDNIQPTMEEYLEIISNFAKQNSKSNFIPSSWRSEYETALGRIKKLIDIFGVQKKEISGDEINIIDISWPNLKKNVEKLLENVLDCKKDGSPADVKGNKKNKEKLGHLELDYEIGDRDEKDIDKDKPITLWQLREFLEQIDQADFDRNILVDLCIKSGEGSRLLRAKDANDGKRLKEIMSDVVKNPTGFQRVLSLFVLSVLNVKQGSYDHYINYPVSFDNNKGSCFRNAININLDEAPNEKYEMMAIYLPPQQRKRAKDDLKNSKLTEGEQKQIIAVLDEPEKIYEKVKELSPTAKAYLEEYFNQSDSMWKKFELDGTNAGTLAHELNHMYHYIIGCYTFNDVHLWFNNFSVLNAPIDVKQEVFPMFEPEYMNLWLEKIKKAIENKNISDVKEKIKTPIEAVIRSGFGTLLFKEYPKDLSLDTLVQSIDIIAKALYIDAWIGCSTDEDCLCGDNLWTDDDEKLTILGNNVYHFKDQCYLIKDRQHEQIYSVRENTSDGLSGVPYGYCFRFHEIRGFRFAMDRLKELLSDIFGIKDFEPNESYLDVPMSQKAKYSYIQS